MFKSKDILNSSIRRLIQKVNWFNKVFVYYTIPKQTLYSIDYNNKSANPLDIIKYTRNIIERIDNIVNLVDLDFRDLREDSGFTSI